LANLIFFFLDLFFPLCTWMARVMNYLDHSGYSDSIISHVHVVMGFGTKIAKQLLKERQMKCKISWKVQASFVAEFIFTSFSRPKKNKSKLKKQN
jgi:hypothetical protein